MVSASGYARSCCALRRLRAAVVLRGRGMVGGRKRLRAGYVVASISIPTWRSGPCAAEWQFISFGSWADFQAQDKLLDWGGGSGLLVRLLRDVGIDAYNYDKYAKNHFASGFSRSDEQRYSFVTAFEVFEHFANPATDLETIFALQPSFFLISTCLFKDEGPDWPYLGPAKSEHVFFYSEAALQLIGRRFGYQVFRLPHEITLFFKSPISTIRLRLANLLLSNDHAAEIAFALKRKWSLSEADNRTIRALIERMDP